jgi:hypothetical protein
MSVHYPSWAITNNNPTSGTIQWKYSNGNPILLNQYDPSTPADYWTTALYQINGGGWYTATSTTYPVSSLSPGDTIQYAIVWWDYASDVGSTSSSNYRISSYTRPSPDPIPSLPTNINISSITSNSAYVTWTIGSYATYTCVRLYRTSDNALLVDSGTGGSSYSLTGLAQNTQYYLTFRSDNYTGVSSWS